MMQPALTLQLRHLVVFGPGILHTMQPRWELVVAMERVVQTELNQHTCQMVLLTMLVLQGSIFASTKSPSL